MTRSVAVTIILNMAFSASVMMGNNDPPTWAPNKDSKQDDSAATKVASGTAQDGVQSTSASGSPEVQQFKTYIEQLSLDKTESSSSVGKSAGDGQANSAESEPGVVSAGTVASALPAIVNEANEKSATEASDKSKSSPARSSEDPAVIGTPENGEKDANKQADAQTLADDDVTESVPAAGLPDNVTDANTYMTTGGEEMKTSRTQAGETEDGSGRIANGSEGSALGNSNIA